MSASLAPAASRPAFDELYIEFLPRIVSFLRARLGDPGDAEDVACQVFARAFKAYHRFELRCQTPAPWLFQIARNAAIDHQHRTALRQRAEHSAAEALDEADDPTSLAERRFEVRQLRHAIARLSKRQRDVVCLRHENGLSFREIGRRLACSEDAAKMLYHRSLHALRLIVAPLSPTCGRPQSFAS